MNSANHSRHANAAPEAKGASLISRPPRKPSRLLKNAAASPPVHMAENILPAGLERSSLRETIRLAQHGDPAAFETLYQLHSGRVYSVCLRILHNPTEAEDLTQEAFLQLFRKIHTFRGESAFSTWLYRLTINVVLMRLRKKNHVCVSLDDTQSGDDEDASLRHDLGGPDLSLTGLFDRISLQAAINQLPQGYKLAFILHDIYGYEHHEIAEIRGCTEGNSKSQLHKARKRLRAQLPRVENSEARQESGTVSRSLETVARF